MASSINTKRGAHILYSSRSAYIDPKVRRSKIKVTGYQVHPALVRMSIRLPMFSSSMCFYSLLVFAACISLNK